VTQSICDTKATAGQTKIFDSLPVLPRKIQRSGFAYSFAALPKEEDSMNNIVKARIKIRGTRPLLQHKFGPEALPLEKGEKTGVAGNDPEEWKRTCMVTKDGQLYVSGTYVFGMLRDAAKHTRRGKGSLSPLVAATLQIEEERILLDRFVPKDGPTIDSTDPVYIHVSGVRNPATKARNIRYRLAAATGWTAECTLLWDKSVVSRDQMKAVLNDAGVLVGLADGRTIGYGRFEVQSFEELINAPETTAA